jgi:hypothetical protein
MPLPDATLCSTASCLLWRRTLAPAAAPQVLEELAQTGQSVTHVSDRVAKCRSYEELFGQNTASDMEGVEAVSGRRQGGG